MYSFSSSLIRLTSGTHFGKQMSLKSLCFEKDLMCTNMNFCFWQTLKRDPCLLCYACLKHCQLNPTGNCAIESVYLHFFSCIHATSADCKAWRVLLSTLSCHIAVKFCTHKTRLKKIILNMSGLQVLVF